MMAFAIFYWKMMLFGFVYGLSLMRTTGMPSFPVALILAAVCMILWPVFFGWILYYTGVGFVRLWKQRKGARP